ncbi:hypothetical protein [Microbacterium sp. zg.Y1084]|uniref:hypothetical protein n=1 Tax=Microbacterium sp. zg.Y1084 TaxID=2969667 RepID=UPI00214ADED1|nr:hypothetical protein [Microbacterium sp. zg.Y1084]MCR2813220.1 hypothetical protein [Microbacterium sp. zg.Y1084]
MTTSTPVRTYIAALFLGGLALGVWGTILPLGGGTLIALIGAAAIGAALVLVGIRLMGPER